MSLKSFAGIPFSPQLITALSVMIGLIIGGTIAYHYMEGWTWAQSFYFVVSTLTTVGYGDLHPSSDASRTFTAVFMLAGVAIAFASLGIIGSSYLKNREEAILKREEKLRNQEIIMASIKKQKRLDRQIKKDNKIRTQQYKKTRKYKWGFGPDKKGPERK